MDLAAAPVTAKRVRRERVLLVDDEPQVLVALQDMLEDSFDVFATDRPEKALSFLENEPEVAVIVSDQRMPGMNGDELFRRVREHSEATRVLSTGYADLQAVIRAVNDGNIFAYVTKPWERDDLLNKLRHAAERFRLTRELQEERQLLDDLMRSIPDAIFFKDREHRFVRVNDGLLKLLGVSDASRLLGKRLSELALRGASSGLAIEAIEAEILQDGRSRRDVVHLQQTPSGPRWISTSNAGVRSVPGEVVGLVGIARDVTERVQTQEALRVSEERLRLAFRASNAGLFDWDIQSGRVSYSTSSPSEPEGGAEPMGEFRPLFEERIHEDDLPLLRSTIEAHLQTHEPFPRLELRAHDALGGYGHVEVNAQALWDAESQPVRLVGSILDITARKEHAAQLARLEFLAHYDDLTGLPNRSFLATRMERVLLTAAELGRRCALILVDVGRLRLVNESLGRKPGDELVVAVAQRLTDILRPSDFLARYEGGTFAIFVDGLEEDAAVAQWFERVVMPKLGAVFSAADTDLRMSFKAGITIFPNDGGSVDVLLANTEAALKKAKHSSAASLFYAPTMNDKIAERLSLEARLRRALENDEFVLFYQPKVNLRTGRVVATEALIRWRDPQRGLVPPGEFIPVLEDTEMILDVGRWVIERAARQFVEWKSSGIAAPRIAVNVSALQLARPDFIETLDAVLQAFPGASSGLDLELTESVLMEDLAGNIEKLRAAKERGLAVAIDDFGTGYSSLGYLSRLPLDALKIDRSFVDQMTEDPQQMSIVSTIISLAHSLHLKVIAEGVETTAQAHLLRLLRCDEIQGYLVSKPVPPEDVVRSFEQSFAWPTAKFGGAA